MKYFKNNNNEIFAYDDEQIKQGYVKDLTLITEKEKDTILNPPKSEKELTSIIKQDISNAIQSMLDTKAKEYRYDNINSIAKYLGYENAFKTECEALGKWASNCWVKAGEIELDVSELLRPQPTVDEVLEEMPKFEGV